MDRPRSVSRARMATGRDAARALAAARRAEEKRWRARAQTPAKRPSKRARGKR